MTTKELYTYTKAKYPTNLLLFRSEGIFSAYEDDAIEVCKTLGVMLMNRRIPGEKETIKAAGFPVSALDFYLPKLVRAGYRIAILEENQAVEIVSPSNNVIL